MPSTGRSAPHLCRRRAAPTPRAGWCPGQGIYASGYIYLYIYHIMKVCKLEGTAPISVQTAPCVVDKELGYPVQMVGEDALDWHVHPSDPPEPVQAPRVISLHGYLAHKKEPPPLGPPYGPRHMLL